MADEKLRIGVEVDVSQAANLTEAAKQVAASVSELNAQFAQGKISAGQYAQSFQSAASALTAANPATTGAATAGAATIDPVIAKTEAVITKIKDFQDALAASLLEADILPPSIGPQFARVEELFNRITSSSQLLKAALASPTEIALGPELARLSVLFGKVETAHTALIESLGAAIPPTFEAQVARITEQYDKLKIAEQQLIETTQSSRAALSQPITGPAVAGPQVAGVAISSAGKEALGDLGSSEVDAAGRKWAALKADLVAVRGALSQVKAEMQDAAAGSAEYASLKSREQELLQSELRLTNAVSSAKRDYNAAFQESNRVKSEQSAALLREQTAQQDAMQMEAAASEGMVASEVESANTVIRLEETKAAARRQAQEAAREAAAVETAANEGMVSSEVMVARAAIATSESVSTANSKLSQTGRTVAELSSAMVTSSSEVRSTGLAWINLGQDLGTTRTALAETREELTKTGLTTQQVAEIKERILDLDAQERTMTLALAEAEKTYRSALTESALEQQRRRAESAKSILPTAAAATAGPSVAAAVPSTGPIDALTAAQNRLNAAKAEYHRLEKAFEGGQLTKIEFDKRETASLGELNAAQTAYNNLKRAAPPATPAAGTTGAPQVAANQAVAASNEKVAQSNVKVQESETARATSASAVTGANAAEAASTVADTQATEANATSKSAAAAALGKLWDAITSVLVSEQTATQATAENTQATEVNATSKSAAASVMGRLWNAITSVFTATETATKATAENAQAVNQGATAADRLANSLKKAGIPAAEIAKILQNQFKMGAEEAAQAAGLVDKQLDNVTKKGGILGTIADWLGVKFENFIRSLGYSTIRLGANEVGAGQLGFALARLGSQIPGIASLMTYAFPIVGAVAAVQMVGQLIDTMNEWRNIEEKSAEEQAKWTREIEKSAEAVDKLRERLAGLASPQAEAAEQLVDIRRKTLDLSSSTELANKRIDDSASLWKSIKEYVGYGATESMHMFDSSLTKTARSLVDFNQQTLNTVTNVGEIGPKLTEVTAKVGELQKQLERVKSAPVELTFTERSVLPPGADVGAAAREKHEDRVAEAQRQLDIERGLQDQLKNIQASGQLERLAILQSMQLKEIATSEAAVRSRIAIAETEAKELLRTNVISMSEETTRQLEFEKQKTEQSLRGLNERKRILEQSAAADKAAGRDTDFTAAYRAMEEERIKIVNDGTKREQEIRNTSNAQIKAANLALVDAEIEGEEKYTLAYMKREEARLRTVLKRADTPELVEAAEIPILQEITREYQIQEEAIRKRAEALVEAKLPKTAELPKAQLGTLDFAKEIEDIQKKFPSLATEVYTQLLQINTRILELRERGAAAEEAEEQNRQDKIREIHRQEVTTAVSALNDSLIEEREKYQQGSLALQANLVSRPALWSSYYSSIQSLAQQNRDAVQAILDQEKGDWQAAADAKFITAQELARHLEEIRRREEQADKQMWARETEAAKAAMQRQEEDIRSVSNKITSEFVRAGHEMLTVHESVGKAAMHLGRDLELGIIEEGIKRVAQRYTSELLQMLTADNSFITRILGIHRAGAAAQTQIDAAAAASKQTIDATSAAKETALETAKTAKTAALETTEVTTHAAGEVAKVGATATGQAAQTAAATSGAAARTNVGLLEDLKAIGRKAAHAAAAVYSWFVDLLPPPAGQIVGAAAAAATFATVMAFTAIAGAAGGMVIGAAGGVEAQGSAQPVLVHSGEVITNVQSLHNMQSAAGGAVAMVKVPSDQVSMLSPGSVVVPRSLSGGLASAAGGVTAVAPGIAPPLGLRESPQRLPSSMYGMIQNIVEARSAAAGYTISNASGGYSIPVSNISGGHVVPTVRLSAAGGLTLPSQEHMNTIQRTVNAEPRGGSSSSVHSRATTNNVNVQYHSHAPAGIQKEHIVGIIKKAIRRGEIG